ncbi:hypothetical protein CAPTEDRAFT_203512 [Capitella teleta]|uniref:DUF4806 domain-containing protein n=1 Tax=Capitella teleta TaxID=283909 RepID=R7VCX9_CAPTE|nr:hypothetical protein CAPTEDRAFT_203512 [Capitella teleta]|eukprot:ELU14156.1 hypothetical protein CAPTEDRAFT_203512 [Capitella teleta]
MKLRNWATKTHQTRESINEMLSIFRDEDYELPKDARTLLRKSAEVRTAQEPKIRDMSGDGEQSLVGFDGDQEHSLINKSDMQSAINILIPPIPPCTPSRTNEPHKFQKRTLHLLVEIRSLLQRAVSQPGELVERGQQYSLYYAEKQFTHIHEFPDLNTEDKQLSRGARRWVAGTKNIMNIMKRYLSKDLEQNLNMDGQRGAKTAFRGSSLHVLIVESVLEKFSSAVTEQRTDEFIRNRLRNATKRQK